MIKFTKEEISLCKQVAEKHRKEIKYGDWVGVWAWAQNHTLHYIAQTHIVMPDNQITKKLHCLNGIRIFEKDVIPLWTISDCLEFFKEKELRYYIVTDNHSTTITIFNPKTDSIITQQSVENSKNSLDIACLKAVLAVLEESK